MVVCQILGIVTNFKQMKRTSTLVMLLFFIGPLFSQHYKHPNRLLPRIEMWDLFETNVPNSRTYDDPFRDVELLVEIKTPDGRTLNHYGFYDGEFGWKIRFSPDELGKWTFKARFSDNSYKTDGEFMCWSADKPGRVLKNRYNPFWLSKGNEQKYLFRSFHVGDRFFAENWDDPNNPDDGEQRTRFLDWIQENKYNMLSIASHYTNRDEEGRGKGWDTPDLWPLNPAEYRKMEQIIDTLNARDITVFPFAGFFGARGDWAVDHKEQELYIKYLLARIGHYPNIILTVAGPEPFWREARIQYKGAMRWVDICRLGGLIDSLDMHDHILTVHNEKRATQYGDPFIDETWYDMSTLQGPTTTDREKMFSGLIMNHHRYKPCYAQETLWPGNKWHPHFTKEQIRKNILTILFSGSILNYADMDGNSSSGFTGSLDLRDIKPFKHEIVNEIWDWFETIPFNMMTSRQDLVKQGFCLANEGVEYYIYADTLSELELHLDFPYMLQTEWINATNMQDTRKGELVNRKSIFQTPKDGDDWILHVYAPEPAIVAEGHFPDIAVDNDGNIHLVYNRGGLYYKKYDAHRKTWSEEEKTGCKCENVKRADPDIVTDSKGNPHVHCGKEYARFDGNKWIKSLPGGSRDSELVIDSEDNVYLVYRGGNSGGYIGFSRKAIDNKNWEVMTDPDQNNKGKSNHVYADIFMDLNDRIHLVHRHGPVVEVTYRSSEDGGQTWFAEENVLDDRGEGPHIVVTSDGVPFISTGKGYVLKKEKEGNWKQHGRKLHVYPRMQPELGIDKQDNIYQTSFGGHYNILNKGVWMGEKIIQPISEKEQVGFVENVGVDDFAYIVWEEGDGNADEGLDEDAKIVVGILYPDGRIIGLY